MSIYKSKWILELPPNYMDEMVDAVLTHRMKNITREQYDTDETIRNNVDQQVFNRMQQAKTTFVPWVEHAFPLKGKSVLEIGSGTGSTTVALAQSADTVQGVDVVESYAAIAETRMKAIQVDNVSIHTADGDWLSSQDRAEAVIRSLGQEQYDAVVCYAVLEHLLPAERINALRAFWGFIKPGGVLTVYETPNRLFWWQWHGAKMPFLEWCPDDIVSVYLKKGSKKFPDHIQVEEIQAWTPEYRTPLHRWGRGVSFHEFDIALGIENLDVIAHAYTKGALDRLRVYPKHAVGFQDMVSELLREYYDLGPEWAYPSLDLVIRKAA